MGRHYSIGQISRAAGREDPRPALLGNGDPPAGPAQGPVGAPGVHGAGGRAAAAPEAAAVRGPLHHRRRARAHLAGPQSPGASRPPPGSPRCAGSCWGSGRCSGDSRDEPRSAPRRMGRRGRSFSRTGRTGRRRPGDACWPTWPPWTAGSWTELRAALATQRRRGASARAPTRYRSSRGASGAATGRPGRPERSSSPPGGRPS